MKITNKYNLPPPLVEAVKRDPYSKGDARFSATELIAAPRQTILKEMHFDDIVVDASDMMWSLFGRGVHNILETYGRKAGLHDYVEERLFLEIDGWRISGGMDFWEDKKRLYITDYKVTTVRAAYSKIEWEQQLNIYAYLFWKTKKKRPYGLRVCAILRDWKNEMAVNQHDYPEAPVIVIPINLWSTAEQLAYIKERIAIHGAARAAMAFGDELPECTPEERWTQASKWAIKRPGGKRATALYDSEAEAKEAVSERKGEYEIEHRPGIPLRCARYCDAAPFCSQWARERAAYDL